MTTTTTKNENKNQSDLRADVFETKSTNESIGLAHVLRGRGRTNAASPPIAFAGVVLATDVSESTRRAFEPQGETEVAGLVLASTAERPRSR